MGTVQESRVRRMAARSGLRLQKSRQLRDVPNVDNFGEYMVIDAEHNFVVAGEKYDWTLDDIEGWLKEREAAAIHDKLERAAAEIHLQAPEPHYKLQRTPANVRRIRKHLTAVHDVDGSRLHQSIVLRRHADLHRKERA